MSSATPLFDELDEGDKASLREFCSQLVNSTDLPDDWQGGSKEEISAFLMEQAPERIAGSQKAARRGLEHLKSLGGEDAAKVVRKIEKRIQAYIEGETRILRFKITNVEWENLLRIAATALQDEQLEIASETYTALLGINNGDARPCIGLCLTFWRSHGVSAAAALFQLYQLQYSWSPSFLYYAADCYVNAAMENEAREAMGEALEQMKSDFCPEIVPPSFAAEINSFATELRIPHSDDEHP